MFGYLVILALRKLENNLLSSNEYNWTNISFIGEMKMIDPALDCSLFGGSCTLSIFNSMPDRFEFQSNSNTKYVRNTNVVNRAPNSRLSTHGRQKKNTFYLN